MLTRVSTDVPPRPDPRIVRSERAIQEALLEALRDGRDFSALTVSEIAAKAGVTRKTFYARFGSLEQVVQRTVQNLFSGIAARIDDELLRLPLADNSLAMLVFKAHEEHQATLAPLVRHCSAGLFVEPVSEVATLLLDRVIQVNHLPPMNEAEHAYLVATVASMVHGVLSVWARRGFREPAERVASFIDTLLADGMQKVVASKRS
ncbi:MAG: TetR/AcrR family transcriptional regulator [Pseudomonadales bacterium]